MRRKQRLRGATAAQWTAINPILGQFEPGYESDTNKLKIGDGSTAWADLDYFGVSGTPITGSLTANYIPVASGATTLEDSIIQHSGGSIGVGAAPVAGYKAWVSGVLGAASLDFGNVYGDLVILRNTGVAATSMGIITAAGSITHYSDDTATNFTWKYGGASGTEIARLNGTGLGIGAVAPTDSRLQIKGSTDTDVAYGIRVGSDTVSDLFYVRNDGLVSVKNGYWIGTNRFATINPNGTSENVFVGSNAGNLTLTSNTNIAFGINALSALSTGTNNVALGNIMSAVNTGSYNVGIAASNCLSSVSSGMFNIGIGMFTLSSITNAQNNIAIGHSALYGLQGGNSNNIAIGFQALRNITTGISNTAIGTNAAYYNAAVSYNVAIGEESLYGSNAGGTTGAQNTSIGYQAIRQISSGNNNTANGFRAGTGITSGSNNTTIGHGAGTTLTTGNNNVAVGYNSAFDDASLSNTIVIGSRTIYTAATGVIGVPDLFIDYEFSPAPAAVSLNGPKASGANIAGATTRITASRSTGTGVGGDLILGVSSAGVAGEALNAIVDALTIRANDAWVSALNGYMINGTQVVKPRITGWAVATGTATRTTFDTATVTTTELAERVKALIDDLHATAGHGLIGT